MQGVTDQFDIHGNILNGYLVAYLILQSLLIHIPLLVALVAGDALAGEANMGTLRLVLTRPYYPSATGDDQVYRQCYLFYTINSLARCCGPIPVATVLWCGRYDQYEERDLCADTKGRYNVAVCGSLCFCIAGHDHYCVAVAVPVGFYRQWHWTYYSHYGYSGGANHTI